MLSIHLHLHTPTKSAASTPDHLFYDKVRAGLPIKPRTTGCEGRHPGGISPELTAPRLQRGGRTRESSNGVSVETVNSVHTDEVIDGWPGRI